MTKEKYPEGHFTGKYMAIFLAVFAGVGVPLSVSTGNNGLIGIGPAIGIIFGLAIGKSIEEKYRKEGKIRPLNKQEKKNQKIAFYGGIAALVIGVLAFLLLYLLA